MKKQKLIPPDKKRCQAERREINFWALGPGAGPFIRCAKKPTAIIGEKGVKGRMSVCCKCLVQARKQIGKDKIIVRYLVHKVEF